MMQEKFPKDKKVHGMMEFETDRYQSIRGNLGACTASGSTNFI